MNWITVSSSRVSQIKYDKDNKKVYVKFKRGNLYVYNNINEDIFNQFKNSSSIGGAISLLGTNYQKIQ